ncbi:TNF receptor-associated factor 4 [Acyrthosiphon pisum]|uniref:TNF receptor-associated factor 4 n=1 Tax=Acyrthosiphon pisum TaxID=7029 RepID=A0A8R1W1F8_ACYPI|nr:TNF receptor-associated factor 4 [Acyrthosiphon pisum]|eukprot:XP_001948355.1 PREDICTED: TNF receptor-associated factor 4 [Acyrthosiphon pisum]
MGRSLALWTKTLSFPSRNSPNKSSKHSITTSINTSSCTIFAPATTPTKDNITPASTPDVSDCEKDKDIMGSVVYCIHHKEGCKWSDQLRRLKGHLQTCKYDALPCTNHCGAQIARILMDDHVRYTCIERVIKCEYCNGEMKGEAAGEEHSRTCPVEPIHCEAKCGVKIPRRMLAKHKVTECSKRLLPCRHCGRQFVADTINSHTTSCPRFPLTCPNRCEIVTVAREDLEHHIKHACHSMLTSCSFKDVGCRFKSLRGKQMDTHMEEASQQHLTLMCSMVTKQQQQIVSMKKVINNLAVNQSGTLIWKITDVLEKLEEGRHKLCGDGLELISSPFYTSQFGYKLQASVFLNGNGSGENTHVSVYIKILPGEFDALLKWSFSHSVAFTLFDQSEKPCNIVESFVPDPSWENFQRPSTQPDSLGFGFPKFVSHETLLKKRQFIKDDTIFLRIKVDPSKIVAV